MSYTVLARRYRSQSFDEIIGQEPIARTLKNAIATQRTAHAYLFSGTRGVGKTSMARIFAKALNATDDLTQKTEIEEAISRGEDLDVIEIDGASNRGINEARELIAGAGLSPARSPYKIYIIDEVHALTRDAFNALLKTMEEPPSHVKFILCTTEPQKVPATIQSRCQRFDFRPIATALIAGHLKEILSKESIKADEDVIMQVARLGNGSMRDALSLLDRLLAAGEETLTGEMLELMLGLPEHGLIRELVGAIAGGDAAEALRSGHQLLTMGSSIEQVLDMMAEYFRDLMVLVTCGEDSNLVDLSTEAKQQAQEHASLFDASGLVHLIAICDAVCRNARGSAAARALFDAALVRMSLSEQLADISALLSGKTRGVEPKTTGASKKKQPVNPQSSVADREFSTPVPTPAPTITELKPQPALSVSIDDDKLWSEVLKAAERAPQMQAVLADLVFESFDGKAIRLSLTEYGRPRARYLETQREKIEIFISKVVEKKIRVQIESTGEKPVSPTMAADDLAKVQQLPMVSRAVELFDAVVIDVQDEPNQEQDS